MTFAFAERRGRDRGDDDVLGARTRLLAVEDVEPDLRHRTAVRVEVLVLEAEDAGGFIHFLEGGTTAVHLPGENGGYLRNSTRELVTPGGSPMPPGSVLFEVDDNGTWIPIRRF